MAKTKKDFWLPIVIMKIRLQGEQDETISNDQQLEKYSVVIKFEDEVIDCRTSLLSMTPKRLGTEIKLEELTSEELHERLRDNKIVLEFHKLEQYVGKMAE